MITKKNLEIEIKIKVDNISETKKKVLNLGFKIFKEKTFEYNITFDKEDKQLSKNNFLLRLRKTDCANTLTFKCPVLKVDESQNYKKREEIETEVSDFDKTRKILYLLGFQPLFIYEKYRETFSKGNVKIMVDQTPIGNYIEIEGKESEIDNTANQLGYNKSHYITQSYHSLFLKSKNKGFMQFDP